MSWLNLLSLARVRRYMVWTSNLSIERLSLRIAFSAASASWAVTGGMWITVEENSLWKILPTEAILMSKEDKQKCNPRTNYELNACKIKLNITFYFNITLIITSWSWTLLRFLETNLLDVWCLLVFIYNLMIP